MTSQPFDVAVVGDNTLDRYLDEPEIGDLIGGNALNVAAQLALAGLKVGYFGAVGDDNDAALIRAAAEAVGVDISGLITMPGKTALTTIRRSEEGDRSFESEDFGVTAEYFPDRHALAVIAASRWAHVGMLPGSKLLGEELTKLSGVPISQDCTVSPEWSRLTVAFASAGEEADTAEELVQQMLADGAEMGVATIGPHGALAGQGGERWRARPAPTEVVDTTGAGDAFMAGFIAATLNGATVDESLEAGVARGSQACQHLGGWPQLPAQAERFS